MLGRKKAHSWKKAHISANKLLIFIALFLSRAKSQRDAEKLSGFSSETCVKWASFCYEACEFWLGKQCSVDGPDKVIKIDESKLGK